MKTQYRVNHGRRNRWGRVVETINVIERATQDRVLHVEFLDNGYIIVDQDRRKRLK